MEHAIASAQGAHSGARSVGLARSGVGLLVASDLPRQLIGKGGPPAEEAFRSRIGSLLDQQGYRTIRPSTPRGNR